MSLLNGPDVAGILDALGRHDAAETLRWRESEATQREYEAEIADLEDQLAEAIREQEAAEAALAECIEATEPVLAAARAYEAACLGPDKGDAFAWVRANNALLETVRAHTETTKDSAR